MGKEVKKNNGLKDSFKKQTSQKISLKSPANKNIVKKTTLLNINSVEIKDISENILNEENNKKTEKEHSMNKSKNPSQISGSKKKLYKFIPIFDLSDLEYN